MASLIPRITKRAIIEGDDGLGGWVSETWKLMLLDNTHDADPVTQEFVSDVSAKEITDAGGVYPLGGVVVDGKVAVNDTNNCYLDATNQIIGPGASLDFRYGVLYMDTGNPATSPIRAQIDFEADQEVTNGTCTIQWNALGIIYII